MATKIDKIMERIALLLARADHPSTPAPEADTARTMAESLMLKYRIEESELSNDERARQGIKPIRMEWMASPSGSPYVNHYYWLAQAVLYHVGARYVQTHRKIDGAYWITFDVFGFESDLRFGALLFQSAKAAFGSLLEPQVEPDLSDATNVYRLRNAGVERIRIAERMGWGTTGSATAKVTRLFKAACAERNEDAAALLGRGNNVKTFRASYAEAFVDEIRMRLWKMANSVDNRALVLQSRKTEVDEMFYTAYPNHRPVDQAHRVESSEDTKCPKCSKAKSGYCRDHGYRRPSKAAYVERPYNHEAAERGRNAAQSVNLGSSTERIAR